MKKVNDTIFGEIELFDMDDVSEVAVRDKMKYWIERCPRDAFEILKTHLTEKVNAQLLLTARPLMKG